MSIGKRGVLSIQDTDTKARECGIPNKQYAAVAAGSLAIAALLCAGIRAGYAQAAVAEQQAAEAAAYASLEAEEGEAAQLEVAPETVTDMSEAQTAVEEILAAWEDGKKSAANAKGRGGTAKGQSAQSAAEVNKPEVAVCVHMLDNSGSFQINGYDSMYSASMIKLLVLAEYLDEVDSGELSPDDTYTLRRADVVGGSGTMQNARLGTAYTLDDVAYLMVSASDNVATNVLIDRMGLENIQEKCSELGLEGTSLVHKLMSTGINDGLSNMISANDAALILGRIANRTLASEEACDRAEQYLLAQKDNEGLAEGLPDSIAFGHKTGSLDDARHDGGIVYAENPYVIVVLTQNIDYDEANNLMEEISAAVYEALG